MEESEGVFLPRVRGEGVLYNSQMSSLMLGKRKVFSPRQFDEMLCKFSLLVKRPVRSESVPIETAVKSYRSAATHPLPLYMRPMASPSPKRVRRLAGLERLSKPQKESLTYKGILLQKTSKPVRVPRTKSPGRSWLPPFPRHL